MKPSASALASLLLTASLAAGCQSAYYPVRYVPLPLEAQVQSASDAQLSGRVLVTVLGVRRADEATGRAAGAELRVRVENLGARPFALEPGDFRLLSADLRPFAEPTVTPPEPQFVEADGSATLDLFFAFPDEESVEQYAMDSLNLRWTVLVEGGERLTAAATFERVYGPYDGSSWSTSVGVGVGL